MTTEGIEYTPTGTVEVTFDDKTYKLGLPKWRHLRRYKEQWAQNLYSNIDEYDRLKDATNTARVEHATKPTKATETALRKARDKMRGYSITPHEPRIEMLKDMFKELGDKPLPEDPDDWPGWLAGDPGLPNAIIEHWQHHPKASGGDPPS